MQQKTYVLLPNFSTSPPAPIEPDQPIPDTGIYQLGDILINPFGPKPRSLNRPSRIPIPASLLLPPDEKTTVVLSSSDLYSAQLGVWASILAGLGFGFGPRVNIGVRGLRKEKRVLRAERLETWEVDVWGKEGEGYVEKVLGSEGVKWWVGEFVGNGRKKIELWMVVGLKVVRGARWEEEGGREVVGSVGGSVGGGGGSGGGGEGGESGSGKDTFGEAKVAELVYERSKGFSFEGSKDFVLAFQLARIKYDVGKRKHQTEISVRNAGLADGKSVDSKDGEGSGLVVGEVAFLGLDGELHTEEVDGDKVGDEHSPVVVFVPKT